MHDISNIASWLITHYFCSTQINVVNKKGAGIRSHYYDAFSLCECEHFFFTPRIEREKLRYWALFSSAKQKGKHRRNSSATSYISLSVVAAFLDFKLHMEASFSCCWFAQRSFRIKGGYGRRHSNIFGPDRKKIVELPRGQINDHLLGKPYSHGEHTFHFIISYGFTRRVVSVQLKAFPRKMISNL